MTTDPKYLLSTDLLCVTIRGHRPFWARKMPPSKRPGFVVYLRVQADGEVPVSYNERTNVETTTRHFFVACAVDVVREQPAVMNLKYGELEVAS